MSVRSDLAQLANRLGADIDAMDAEIIELLRHHERQIGTLLRWLESGEGDPGSRFDYTEWLRVGAILMGRERAVDTHETLSRIVAAMVREEEAE